MDATYGDKIEDERVCVVLDAIADHLSHVQRHLFVDRYVRGKSLATLKGEYLLRFGLTARQFNSLADDLAGKVASSRKAAARQLRRLTVRITHLRQYIVGVQTRMAGEPRADRRETLRLTLHQKKRHLCAFWRIG